MLLGETFSTCDHKVIDTSVEATAFQDKGSVKNGRELASARFTRTKSDWPHHPCKPQMPKVWSRLGLTVSKENRKYLFRISGSCFGGTAGEVEDIIKEIVRGRSGKPPEGMAASVEVVCVGFLCVGI